MNFRRARSLLFAALLLPGFGAGCAKGPRSPIPEAIILNDKGRVKEAVELLERHLARYPDAIAERRLLVRLHGATGDLGAARRQAELLAQKLGPASPIPWLELGHALELAHHYDEALDFYDQAASVAAADPAGPRTGGLRAAAWGEIDWAEPRLREAVRRDPNDARTWHALGLVLARKGDLPGAEQAYKTGLLRDPTGLDNRIGLATLALLRDDPTRVLAEYDAIVAAHPRFADAQLGRSWALVRLGRFDEARAALDHAALLGASAQSIERQRRWLAAERAKSAGNR